jgi:hypothetical protein
VLIRELLDRLDILLIQLNLLEVLCDTRSCYRLRDDGVSSDLAPCQDNLGRSSTLLLGNGLDLRPCNEQRDVKEVITEGGVGGDVDVLLLGVGDELLAGEDGVALDLVDGGNKTRLINELLERFGSEIGHACGAGLALRQCVHGLPCFAVGDRIVDVDLVRVGRRREEIGVGVFARAEVYGPVDEVEVLRCR